MVGNRQRTSTRQTWNEGAMLNAIDAVKNGEMGWLKASKLFNVPQATLRRSANDVNKKAKGCAKVLGRFSSTFNEAEEKELVGHILLLESRLFGLTTKDIEQLAFEFATRNGIPNRKDDSTINSPHCIVAAKRGKSLREFALAVLVGTSRWKRPLTLNELLGEVENVDEVSNIPDAIILYPPENANDYNTDEDSGEEDNVVLNNLPGSQLRGNVEVFINEDEEKGVDVEEDWESEDESDVDLLSFYFLSMQQVGPTESKTPSKCLNSAKQRFKINS
ncbi:helix-turn-helix psq domain [Holotrichia oblita]|uniref:Helix-turn-helix psq domain n=1 Tax=Holotrichia oblita TaxID=644536 RepID=A0ACB9TRY3_HOLOL|nr:helix-turn-helix psq domain [Holotrichia oblita]